MYIKLNAREQAEIVEEKRNLDENTCRFSTSWTQHDNIFRQKFEKLNKTSENHCFSIVLYVDR